MFVFWKFGVLCFLETPVLRFALLAYYRRFIRKIFKKFNKLKQMLTSCLIARKKMLGVKQPLKAAQNGQYSKYEKK